MRTSPVRRLLDSSQQVERLQVRRVVGARHRVAGRLSRARRPLGLERLENRLLLAAEAVSLAHSALYGDSGNLGSSSSVSSFGPSISADGQLVVFDSYASNLTPTDTNGHTRDVFLRDLSRGVTTLISFNRTGNGSGNRESKNPLISADGRFVAFESDANDLVPNDLNDTRDVFVRDVVNGITHLVTHERHGDLLSGRLLRRGGHQRHGRFVLFRSGARNLILAFLTQTAMRISLSATWSPASRTWSA